jgi:hypothetical protein
MEAMQSTTKTKPSEAGVPLVPGLCLLAILTAACSVDVSKLRASVTTTPDAPLDHPIEADVGEDAGTDADSSTSDSDTMVVDTDLPSADEPIAPDGDLVKRDAPGDAGPIDVLLDASDSPLASEAGGDSTIDTGKDDGVGGHGGYGGTRDAGRGGAGGTFTGLGGAGGTGGRGGAGGTGGIGATGGSSGTGGIVGSGGAESDLVLWYKFDESSGTVAADSSPSGTGTRNGTLGTAGYGGTAAFTTDSQVGTHALSLTASSYGYNPGGGYVTLPAPASLAPSALTIAVWVKLTFATSSQNWERIFEFGSGTGAVGPYFYMTARASDSPGAPVRFGISKTGRSNPNEERLEGTSALTAGVWHHIAVVLPAEATYTGTLYIDGVVAATNKSMTLHLSDVGTTTQNWLGRSPFTDDPYFSGSLDDFRMYKRALSPEEIADLMALR